MKLLLTSGGVTNASIHDALVDLLGKPIAECHALCIPTAQWGHPMCGPASVRGFIAAEPEFRYLSGLGWASLGVIELTALPTIGAERWVPWISEDRRALGRRWRCDVFVPLDAVVRTGRFAAFADRHSLGWRNVAGFLVKHLVTKYLELAIQGDIDELTSFAFDPS